jgi:uncharacterized membrane protein YccC
MPGVVRRIASGAFSIDRHAIEPVFVVRSAIGVTIALLGGFLTGSPIYAVSGAIGAMSTGFGSLQGVYVTRAALMLGMAAAMAASTAVGLLCAHSVVLSVVALAIWGLGYGLFSSLGPGAAGIAINATIALIIFEHFPQTPMVGAICALMMFAGGVVQTLLVVVLWPIQRYPQERRALAAAYRELAAFTLSPPERTSVPSNATLRAVRATLGDPRPFGRRAAAAAFQTLLDEAERMRATLALLATSGSHEYQASRATIAAALGAIADALESAHAPDDGELQAGLTQPRTDPALRALYGQLRAAWRSARVPMNGIAIPRPMRKAAAFPAFDEPLSILRANLRLDAPFGRHAIRLAVVLAACGLIGPIFALQRGYWITLTAALVLRPDFTTTFARGFARIAGTIVGVLAATALVLAVPDTPHVYLGLAVFFAAIGYAAFQLNYALFSLTITAYVVLLLSLLGVPEHAAVVNRLFATIGGGLIAMLSYVIWPTWEARRTLPRLSELVQADLRYTCALLDGLSGPAPRDAAKLARLRSEVWAARASAEESLERTLGEPRSAAELDSRAALGIMAATQRLGLANTALSSLYLDAGTPAFPELATLRVLLQAEPVERIGGLRDAFAELERAIGDAGRPGARAMISALDVAVDSINTLAEHWQRAEGARAAQRESPERA